MRYFAYFLGMICTANPDGSIPLNSRMVLDLREMAPGRLPDSTELYKLLEQANVAHELADSLDNLLRAFPLMAQAQDSAVHRAKAALERARLA